MAARSKPYWSVDCNKHGSEDARAMPHRRLRVGAPKNKTQRKELGCPRCAREAKANA